MYIPTRRIVLLGSGAMLFGCSTSTTPDTRTPLQMAQVYTDDLADALSASATAYLNSTPPPTQAQVDIVRNTIAQIQAARAAIDALTSPTAANTISTIKTIIIDVQTIEPLLAPLLGPAALYIPLALGVLQAFVDALPPPPAAPPVPPAALHEKAMAFRRRNRR